MDRSIKLTSFKSLFKLLPIILLLWPTPTLAVIFNPPPTDLSVTYIGMIFGGSIGSISLGGASSPFLGSLFQAINGVILTIAIFILSYVSGVAIINTAHQGEAMGKKWSSIWIPLRSMVGLLLLAPVPGSGYSLLQVTAIWIILNGVGAADKVWNLVVDNLAQGISATQSAELDNGTIGQLIVNAKSLGPGLLHNLVCLSLVNRNIDTHLLQGTNNALDVYYDNNADGVSGTVYFGIKNLTNPADKTNLNMCGSIPLSVGVSSSELGLPVSNTQLKALKGLIYQTKKEAINAMISKIWPVANKIVDDANVATTTDSLYGHTYVTSSSIVIPWFDQGFLYEAVNVYENLMSNLTKQEALVQLGLGSAAPTAGSTVTSHITNAKTQGWITAGSFYFLLSQGASQNSLSDSTRLITTNPYNQSYKFTGSTIHLTSGGSSLKDLFNPFLMSMTSGTGAAIVHNLFEPPLNAPNTSGSFRFVKSWGELDPAFITLTVLTPVGAGLVALTMAIEAVAERFINDIIDAGYQGDQLLHHARVGANLMYGTEVALIVLIIAIVDVTIIGAICSAIQPAAAMIANTVISIIVTVVPICIMMWTFGATLSIYMPMVPYMIFTITAIGWIILVIEAIVAAPIVSLGLIMPSQDELGDIKPALGILAGIFLRPLLMIVGLILSNKLFTVAMNFISFGFSQSVTLLTDMSNNRSLYACIPIVGLYVGFTIALENKCFGLIYQLPDKILRWIGGPTETSGVEELKEAKGGFDQGAKMGTTPLQKAEGAAEGASKQVLGAAGGGGEGGGGGGGKGSGAGGGASVSGGGGGGSAGGGGGSSGGGGGSSGGGGGSSGGGGGGGGSSGGGDSSGGGGGGGDPSGIDNDYHPAAQAIAGGLQKIGRELFGGKGAGGGNKGAGNGGGKSAGNAAGGGKGPGSAGGGKGASGG